jgi:hypothetical protein
VGRKVSDSQDLGKEVREEMRAKAVGYRGFAWVRLEALVVTRLAT